MTFRTIALALLTSISTTLSAQSTFSAPAGKEIYIPKELRSNDFTSPDSKWSYARMAYTDDIVVFWEKPFGNDISAAPDLEGHSMKVNLPNLIDRLQSFYNVFKQDMKFTLEGTKADKYRMMVMLNYSLEGTAYGGDYDQVIGALWIAPNRIQDNKLNCIAHELGHSFQSQVACDGHGESWGGGGIFEMASQWMLWHVNPEWTTDENFHWRAFIDGANLRFLAIENIYHSPYILEYWAMKHGITVIADLFREGRRGEDPASTYMRLFSLTTEGFAREALDCYSRLITFDFPGKHETSRQYSGELLNDKPLETFGVNVIKLDTKGKKSVKISFKAEDANDGFAYRLVSVNSQDEATYGDIITKPKGTIKKTVTQDTKSVYLVVTGYPKNGYKPYTFNPYEGNSEKEPEHIYKYTYKE